MAILEYYLIWCSLWEEGLKIKLMLRILTFLSLAFLLFSVISYIVYENYLELKLEDAIIQGYPNTQDVDVKIEAHSPWSALKGQIEYCRLNIAQWDQKNWQIDWFEGEFEGVKINMNHLLIKRTLVIENIEKGAIMATIGEANLRKALKNYYKGIDLKIVEDNLVLTLRLTILGRELKGEARGNLVLNKGELVFAPKNIKVNGFNPPRYIEQQVLEKMRIPIPLEEMPFPFAITTVNIMQGKIIIVGKV